MTGRSRDKLHAYLLQRLRFKQLALLAALDDHHNLHRAAAAVHLAQPSATKLVRDLEKILGFAIFERLPRGMQPTELGAEVLSFAKRTLSSLERLAEDLQSRRCGGAGELVLGATVDAAPDVVARAVAELKTQQPNLSIKLRGDTNGEIVSLLLDSKVDLAVGRLDSLRHSHVDFEPLTPEVLSVVARADHSLAHLSTIRLSMLQSCMWIIESLASSLWHFVHREFLEIGTTPPTNVIECAAIPTTLQLLRASDSVAPLPESIVQDHLMAGLLIRLPVAFASTCPPIGVLSRRAEPLSAAAFQFVACLRRHGMYAEKPQALGTTLAGVAPSESTEINRVGAPLRTQRDAEIKKTKDVSDLVLHCGNE
jgi:DNA-binding transcriptional LysR family regulator